MEDDGVSGTGAWTRRLGAVALVAASAGTSCAEPRQAPPATQPSTAIQPSPTPTPAPSLAPEPSPPAGGAEGASPRATVKAIAADPGAWLDRPATLTGVLTNEGTNYFTDLRVVLKDAEGRTLPVKPWLPAALPPGPASGPRPRTLAQYLGKRVELQASVRRGELRASGSTYYLEVRSARVVD
jgi:hypothetical protein